MKRLLSAFRNSVRALRRLLRSEKAFQQECVVFLVALPAGWFLATSWRAYALLLASIVLVMIVEVLNTGIEAACDALSLEFNLEIQFAKDCGSLAVLMAVFVALAVWGLAVAEHVWGAAL